MGYNMKKTSLREFVESTLKLHSITRGNVPEILGFKNSTKALRRLDELMNGNTQDEEFINRLRASYYFSGIKLEQAIRETAHKNNVDRKEIEKTRELRFRNEFIPHGWLVTDLGGRDKPRGMICMAIPREKYITIPSQIIQGCEQELVIRVGKYFNTLCEESKSKVNTSHIFGEPIRILFRYDFDHCHVYDIKSRKFIGTRSVNWKTDECKYLYY